MSTLAPTFEEPSMVVHTATPLSRALPTPERVWYASYGSNMHMDRLAAYIASGTPPGATRTYPGCRDQRAPERSIAVEMPGCLYFATESPVWSGGRGFYDPTAPGRMRGRAHLVTVSQVSDIAAQEMYQEPGVDLDLTAVLRAGRDELGPGRYETLICPGTIEDIPVLTFTAPWTLGDIDVLAPSAAYLRYLAGGLLESGPWEEQDIAEYLAACPGASGRWTAAQVQELLCTDLGSALRARNGRSRMDRNAPPHDFQVGDVLRVSCPPAEARVAEVSRFYAAVEWPWDEIDPQSRFRWNGQRAFAMSADSPEWTTSLFKTDPEPWNLRGGDSCLVGIPETLVRIIDIGRYDPPRDVGWLPRPHTLLGVVPADYPDEALSEDDVDTIYLDSAAPVTIELVSRS